MTRLKTILCVLSVLLVLAIGNYIGFLIFRVNHPGAPWWGFFLN